MIVDDVHYVDETKSLSAYIAFQKDVYERIYDRRFLVSRGDSIVRPLIK